MKILVTSRVREVRRFKPKRVFAKWRDKVFTCCKCGCQFQLQRSDRKKIVAVLQEIDGGTAGLNGVVVYQVLCPEEDCSTPVEIRTIVEAPRSLEEAKK